VTALGVHLKLWPILPTEWSALVLIGRGVHGVEQIKSFCRPEERENRTPLPLVVSDSKSQTEVSWLRRRQPHAFHFQAGQGIAVSLSLV